MKGREFHHANDMHLKRASKKLSIFLKASKDVVTLRYFVSFSLKCVLFQFVRICHVLAVLRNIWRFPVA